MNLSIYQARNGKIYIRNGLKSTPLTKQQIDELHLSVFEIDDFDFDDYKAAYQQPPNNAVAADRTTSTNKPR